MTPMPFQHSDPTIIHGLEFFRTNFGTNARLESNCTALIPALSLSVLGLCLGQMS